MSEQPPDPAAREHRDEVLAEDAPPEPVAPVDSSPVPAPAAPRPAPAPAAVPEPATVPVPEAVPELDWRRLDARMLLVHPLETLIRSLPAVLAIFLARAGSDSSERWELIAVPLILAYGALRWVTTRYCIQGGQIELRRGLLHKQTTTARLDKVRTVDLTAKVYHRVLGLAKVEISTGSSAKERLVLDSLRVDQGRRLRAELLHRVDPTITGLPAPTGAPVDATALGDTAFGDTASGVVQGGDVELLRLDPSWVRYAPLTLTGLVTAAAIVGFASQVLRTVGDESQTIKSGARWVGALAWWTDVLLLMAGVSVLAVIAYVLTFWGFRLTRNQRGSLHTRRGLLTNRETSIDHTRVRGIRFDVPLGLRLAGGRRLKVVTTGLSHERGGSDWLCPPAPAAVVTALATTIVPDEDAVRGPLQQHGTAARRRRLTRTVVPVLVLLAAVMAATLVWSWPWTIVMPLPVLVVAAVALARDRYAGLGHRVTPEHLVAGEGSLDRRRVVLNRSGIIGWKVEQSFFQRRAGVANLVATTAAGQQHYDLLDVPLERAYAVMAEISPDLLAEFGGSACASDTPLPPPVPDAQ
ncbi:MAG: PH domain-containing protein [Humibacillus sp.]|nr:PH domain-containing protein [Humibacillus sp.]MDN5777838.1 PH domain-containing protein [Humibacillus sp.]